MANNKKTKKNDRKPAPRRQVTAAPAGRPTPAREVTRTREDVLRGARERAAELGRPVTLDVVLPSGERVREMVQPSGVTTPTPAPARRPATEVTRTREDVVREARARAAELGRTITLDVVLPSGERIREVIQPTAAPTRAPAAPAAPAVPVARPTRAPKAPPKPPTKTRADVLQDALTRATELGRAVTVDTVLRSGEKVKETVAPKPIESRQDVINRLAAGALSPEKAQQEFQRLRRATVRKGFTFSPIRAIKDTLIEAATFSKVETETFNRRDLERKFDGLRADTGQAYDQAVREAQAKGLEVTETRAEYVDRNLGTKEEYVQEVLKAAPTLSKIAKEVGLASIPFYGTARTWEDSPWWARGLSIAADIAFLVPMVGQVSAGVRAGTTIPRVLGRVAITEVKAPFSAVRHPIRTTKAALEPLETLLLPKKVPLAATEIRTSTVRIPAEKIGVAEAKRARDIATAKAIAGEKAEVVTRTGTAIELTPTALKKVAPVAVHTTPDIRPFLEGGVVEFGREGGLFVSPTLQTRFTRASAFGELPKDGIPGALIIRDPEVLRTLQSSGKLFKGTAEIEAVVPAGVRLPRPSQTIFTRDAAGNRLTLAVIGKPLTPAELAKLKFVGAVDTVRDIFRPALTIRRRQAGRQLNTFIDKAGQAEDLNKASLRASRAGNLAEARTLERQALALEDEARVAITQARRSLGSAGQLRTTALYFGTQDINRAINTLGNRGRPPTVTRPLRAPTPTRVAPTAAPPVARPGVPPAEAPPAAPPPARAEPVPVEELRPTVTPARVRPVAAPPRVAPTRVPARVPPGPPRRRPAVPRAPGVPPVTPARVVRPEEVPTRARFRFRLPRGESLAPGVFPRVVSWPQGAFTITQDLDTGQRTFTRRRAPTRVTPRQGFKVVTTDKTKPARQSFRQGVVVIDVTARRLRFRARRKKGLT